MTIHNLEGALTAQRLGFNRAVLSRELSIEEISHICKNTNIEIETFIHGALCVSYSGQCLFSSMIGGRSGNRGKCAGPCRLPYKLISEPNDKDLNKSPKTLDSGYLLSTKDLCGLDFLPRLIDAGVMCFKIEGRMKTPEYVATVTRIYRKYIDLYLSDKPFIIDKKDRIDLLQVFNRGGFSTGHFSSEPNQELVYKEKANHMGIYLGNVSNVKPNKGHVFLNLNDELSIGDTIMFERENTKYTVSELMVNNKNMTKVKDKTLIEIGRMKGNIKIGDKIYKVDNKELSTISKTSYESENKKIDLQADIIIKEHKPIVLNINVLDENPIYSDINISVKSNSISETAKSKPITEDRIISQLSKTKDTIFNFKTINVTLDNNLFIPSISELNELRRSALNQILDIAKKRIVRNKTNIILPHNEEIKFKDQKYKINNNISILLNNLDENYDYNNLSNDISKIYIPLKFFASKKYETIIENLSNKFLLYIYLPPIVKAHYINILNNLIENSIEKYNIKGFIVSNISSDTFIHTFFKGKETKYDFIANYTLNVYNNYSEEILKEFGISTITISPELNKETIDSILNYKPNLKREIIIYGRTPLMNANYCLLGCTNKCYPTCGVRCKEDNKYYLQDRLGFLFRVIPDNIQTVTTIYNSKITSLTPTDFNATSYRIDIIDETIDEINNIIKTVLEGNRMEGKDYTNGNLARDI